MSIFIYPFFFLKKKTLSVIKYLRLDIFLKKKTFSSIQCIILIFVFFFSFNLPTYLTNCGRFVFAHTGSHTVAFHNEWGVRAMERTDRSG